MLKVVFFPTPPPPCSYALPMVRVAKKPIMEQVSCYLTRAEVRHLNAIAAREGVKRSEVLRQLIRDGLVQDAKEHPGATTKGP